MGPLTHAGAALVASVFSAAAPPPSPGLLAGWMADHAPAVLALRFLGLAAWQWLGVIAAALLAYLLGMGLARVVLGIADRVVRRTAYRWDDDLVEAARAPARFLIALGLFGWLLAPLGLGPAATAFLGQVQSTLLVVCGTWLAARLVDFLASVVQTALCDGKTELEQRAARTQVSILRRVVQVAVVLIGTALVLTQFEAARKVGMSLLASAGVAGIVLGLAAQKSISSLLAGIQLSITQPIRIGDAVIVEGEWGTVEEINLTYVVVRVWDLRRLVVPITRFLEQPFQNWTKVSPDLLGTVEVPVDFMVPVDQVRAELKRLCEKSALWDKKACALQVTAITERTITLRALVSAEDAPRCFSLRCEVREGLVNFLQGLEGGRYLPLHRVSATGVPSLEKPAPSPLAASEAA